MEKRKEKEKKKKEKKQDERRKTSTRGLTKKNGYRQDRLVGAA